MKWVHEVLLDEPDCLRETRIGNWILCHDYETGEGEWNYEPIENAGPPTRISQEVQPRAASRLETIRTLHRLREK